MEIKHMTIGKETLTYLREEKPRYVVGGILLAGIFLMGYLFLLVI